MDFSQFVKPAESQPIEFKILILQDDGGAPVQVWERHGRYTDGIDYRDIVWCDEERKETEEILRSAGVSDAAQRVQVLMSAGDIIEAEVGPAISHVPFMVERYSESPHKYVRPPRIVRPELLLAMMRSHRSIIALEAAEAERTEAQADLDALEVEAGMHEPSIWG